MIAKQELRDEITNLERRIEVVRDGARGLFELKEENEKTISTLEQQNAKLVEVLKELMQSSEDWNVEDWIEAKKKVRILLAEVK
jgi:hypothetical protein